MPVVVMDEWILSLAEGMGISYEEAEEEVDRCSKEQIIASLQPLLEQMARRLIEARQL